MTLQYFLLIFSYHEKFQNVAYRLTLYRTGAASPSRGRRPEELQAICFLKLSWSEKSFLLHFVTSKYFCGTGLLLSNQKKAVPVVKKIAHSFFLNSIPMRLCCLIYCCVFSQTCDISIICMNQFEELDNNQDMIIIPFTRFIMI